MSKTAVRFRVFDKTPPTYLGIGRSIFTSVEDLARKLPWYIKSYNKEPKPIKWIYGELAKHIRLAVDSGVTVH